MADILIALGANLPSTAGPPAATLEAAAARLPDLGLRLIHVSSQVVTPAFPPGQDQPDYFNAVARAETDWPPGAVLDALLALEARFGRSRQAGWAARPLDLDLLAYGNWVSAGYWLAAAAGQAPPEVPPPLLVPHPRLHGRRFVLEPLCEIWPDWRHPALGLSASELLARLRLA